MSTNQHRTSETSFLEAGFRGWAWLQAVAGGVLLAYCLVFSLLTMELETLTLAMGGVAFLFAGTCWVGGRIAREFARP